MASVNRIIQVPVESYEDFVKLRAENPNIKQVDVYTDMESGKIYFVESLCDSKSHGGYFEDLEPLRGSRA